MPTMYFGDPTPSSPRFNPTNAPHFLSGGEGLDLKSTNGLQFLAPSTEQADAWAWSLLNLSPTITKCDHADSSCDCWQGAPGSNTTLLSHEPTGLSHGQAPSTYNNLDPCTGSIGGSSSSPQSCSGSSTKHERSSAIRTRETSYASAEDIERSLDKPSTMPVQARSQASQPVPATATCIYVLPKMAGSDHRDNLHFALYLNTHTLNDFIPIIAMKCNMLSHQILRTVRIDESGVEVAVNDTMVREMKHEQAVIAEFRDIGLPPDLHPSFADAAGFRELKSRFFELRLLY